MNKKFNNKIRENEQTLLLVFIKNLQFDLKNWVQERP